MKLCEQFWNGAETMWEKVNTDELTAIVLKLFREHTDTTTELLKIGETFEVSM